MSEPSRVPKLDRIASPEPGQWATWYGESRAGYGFPFARPVVIRRVGPKRAYVEGRQKNRAGEWVAAFRWVARENLGVRRRPCSELGEASP